MICPLLDLILRNPDLKKTQGYLFKNEFTFIYGMGVYKHNKLNNLSSFLINIQMLVIFKTFKFYIPLPISHSSLMNRVNIHQLFKTEVCLDI